MLKSGAAAGSKTAAVENLLIDLRSVRHLDIRLLDANGKLLAGNHVEAPVSSAPAWFVALVDLFSAPAPALARDVLLDGHTPGSIVLAADPSSETDEIWRTFRTLGGLAAILFLALNGLVYWLLVHSLAPLDKVLAAFAELQKGNYKIRLPKFRLAELARMSTLFNEMAATMEQARAAQCGLTRKLMLAQEEERRNLARELHDELGQCQAAIHAEACFIVKRAEQERGSVLESARAIVAVTADMQKLTRSMLARLRPSALSELGLEDSLRELVSAWAARQQQVACTLDVEGGLDDLDEPLQLAVYRIVQEALTNISRHSDADCVKIAVQRKSTDARIHLQIADNGKSERPPQPGLGLLGMQERVSGLGGYLELIAESERGFKVIAVLPIPGDSAGNRELAVAAVA
ncbi:MAG: histidine kinase [Pseudomonadota bacterium]|nr:sensor histidine kinase [Burkholderiales bacterium]MDQ3196938.1 histidine kinase [Pseudomonadota bacterium]